ncbi:hypothetical protein [Desertimonas flava]|uniref:hypothetical protein n=1 Tax=Desertimonas flava TaxID=2064846 RepID=UPI000E34124D|nr:hypothetical protein [Desertimonas flava]
MRKRAAMLLLAGASAVVPGVAAAQVPPDAPPSRQPFIVVPDGCPIQQLADVVFVGTVTDRDFRTVRFRIDQIRAGDMGAYASQLPDGNFYVDVRYGVDAKYLDDGGQFLVGASRPENSTTGYLESKVAERPAPIGDDEVIGADESDLVCPEVDDPNVTLHTDGSSVDSGLFTPLLDDRGGLLRAVLVAVGSVLGGVLALAAVRWILTGFGRGVESLGRPRNQAPRLPRS